MLPKQVRYFASFLWYLIFLAGALRQNNVIILLHVPDELHSSGVNVYSSCAKSLVPELYEIRANEQYVIDRSAGWYTCAVGI